MVTTPAKSLRRRQPNSVQRSIGNDGSTAARSIGTAAVHANDPNRPGFATGGGGPDAERSPQVCRLSAAAKTDR
jgi:hypothetical protein